MLEHSLPWITGLLLTVIHVLGVYSAIRAVMHLRTAQGAIAWAISLLTIPYIALPFYWAFGARRFHGYVHARREGDQEIHHLAQDLVVSMRPFAAFPDGKPVAEQPECLSEGNLRALESLSSLPFTTHNQARLLIDGPATFHVLFTGIRQARRYVLVQFFIIRDDALGRELATLLKEKAAEGVHVHLLYDAIGCYQLPDAYVDGLRAAGVEVEAFRKGKRRSSRFQLNFRNHRKIVVVDGCTAYLGGHNVGEEYLGKSKEFPSWRDTHIRLQGPAVQHVQMSFVQDWYWACGEIPPLNWQPEAARPDAPDSCAPTDGKGESAIPVAEPAQDGPDRGQAAMVLPTGPADSLETCSLFFVHAIHSARRRIWIATPYFVPDIAVVSALQLAGLRGVDVRILSPMKPDHFLVYLSMFSYVPEIEPFGVRFYRYLPGFMHQKVLLVDDDMAAVGTANLDNRSFRLNFEITALLADKDFASQVEAMLKADLERSAPLTAVEVAGYPTLFKIVVKIARLLSPVQ